MSKKYFQVDTDKDCFVTYSKSTMVIRYKTGAKSAFNNPSIFEFPIHITTIQKAILPKLTPLSFSDPLALIKHVIYGEESVLIKSTKGRMFRITYALLEEAVEKIAEKRLEHIILKGTN